MKEKESVRITECGVFPGIIVLCRDISGKRKADRAEISVTGVNGQCCTICCCLEGRSEFRDEKKYYYLTEGDMRISLSESPADCSQADYLFDREENVSGGNGTITEGNGPGGNDNLKELYYPLGRCREVLLMIDRGRIPDEISILSGDVIVNPSLLIEKYCVGDKSFIASAGKEISSIFLELYRLCREGKEALIKILTMELLLRMQDMSAVDERKTRQHFTHGQVLLVKGVCEYMLSRPDERHTIEELSKKFHVSGTQLKNTFKGVYGTSVYAFIRGEKMRAAANDLRETDLSVLEIAGKYGYENGSKFARAFRDTLGVSPNGYRLAIRHG